jgi:hypothetical protein
MSTTISREYAALDGGFGLSQQGFERGRCLSMLLNPAVRNVDDVIPEVFRS